MAKKKRKKTSSKKSKRAVAPTVDVPYIAEPLRRFAIKCDELKTDQRNARTHSSQNRETIKYSLQKFGQRIPIIVRRATMMVIAGNERLSLHQELGWDYIACIFTDDNEGDASEFALLDNRSGELGDWDYQTLSDIVATLDSEDYDISLLGWSDDELQQILQTDLSPPPEVTRAVTLDEKITIVRIQVTEEQKLVLDVVVEKIRATQGADTSYARCLELAMADWLAGAS